MPLGLLGAFLLAGLSGCIFSPDTGNGKVIKPPATYRIRAHPQDVLFNLIQAYRDRDSSKYLEQFAVDYQGNSYDTDTIPGFQAAPITRADEEAHIKKLAEDRDIIRVELDLHTEGQWIRDPAIGNNGEPDWASITISGPTLAIDSYSGSWNLKSNLVLEYAFRPQTPAPTSPTDTLWTIGRWIESGQ